MSIMRSPDYKDVGLFRFHCIVLINELKTNTVDAGIKNIVGNCIQCSYIRHVIYNGYCL